jgi:hypothetical protein
VTDPEPLDEPDGPPRGFLIAALAVAAAAVIALLVVAAVRESPETPQPVALATMPAPQAGGDECRALLEALPGDLGEYRRATLVEPAPAGAAAWQADTGAEASTNSSQEAVVLRCGLDRPVDFVAGAPVQVVDAVSWFRVGEQGRSTWVTVDRPVYVALTLPDGSGPSPIQVVSKAVAATMPAVPVDPAPVG